MASSGDPSFDRQLALVGSDLAIYQHLPPTNSVPFSTAITNYPDNLCRNITATECLDTEGSSWPDPRTFARQDVEELLGTNLVNYQEQGFWTLFWDCKRRKPGDIIHGDGFRSVLGFKAIHVMVRKRFNDSAPGPARL